MITCILYICLILELYAGNQIKAIDLDSTWDKSQVEVSPTDMPTSQRDLLKRREKLRKYLTALGGLQVTKPLGDKQEGEVYVEKERIRVPDTQQNCEEISKIQLDRDKLRRYLSILDKEEAESPISPATIHLDPWRLMQYMNILNQLAATPASSRRAYFRPRTKTFKENGPERVANQPFYAPEQISYYENEETHAINQPISIPIPAEDGKANSSSFALQNGTIENQANDTLAVKDNNVVSNDTALIQNATIENPTLVQQKGISKHNATVIVKDNVINSEAASSSNITVENSQVILSKNDSVSKDNNEVSLNQNATIENQHIGLLKNSSSAKDNNTANNEIGLIANPTMENPTQNQHVGLSKNNSLVTVAVKDYNSSNEVSSVQNATVENPTQIQLVGLTKNCSQPFSNVSQTHSQIIDKTTSQVQNTDEAKINLNKIQNDSTIFHNNSVCKMEERNKVLLSGITSVKMQPMSELNSTLSNQHTSNMSQIAENNQIQEQNDASSNIRSNPGLQMTIHFGKHFNTFDNTFQNTVPSAIQKDILNQSQVNTIHPQEKKLVLPKEAQNGKYINTYENKNQNCDTSVLQKDVSNHSQERNEIVSKDVQNVKHIEPVQNSIVPTMLKDVSNRSQFDANHTQERNEIVSKEVQNVRHLEPVQNSIVSTMQKDGSNHSQFDANHTQERNEVSSKEVQNVKHLEPVQNSIVQTMLKDGSNNSQFDANHTQERNEVSSKEVQNVKHLEPVQNNIVQTMLKDGSNQSQSDANHTQERNEIVSKEVQNIKHIDPIQSNILSTMQKDASNQSQFDTNHTQDKNEILSKDIHKSNHLNIFDKSIPVIVHSTLLKVVPNQTQLLSNHTQERNEIVSKDIHNNKNLNTFERSIPIIVPSFIQKDLSNHSQLDNQNSKNVNPIQNSVSPNMQKDISNQSQFDVNHTQEKTEVLGKDIQSGKKLTPQETTILINVPSAAQKDISNQTHFIPSYMQERHDFLPKDVSNTSINTDTIIPSHGKIEVLVPNPEVNSKNNLSLVPQFNATFQANHLDPNEILLAKNNDVHNQNDTINNYDIINQNLTAFHQNNTQHIPAIVNNVLQNENLTKIHNPAFETIKITNQNQGNKVLTPQSGQSAPNQNVNQTLLTQSLMHPMNPTQGLNLVKSVEVPQQINNLNRTVVNPMNMSQVGSLQKNIIQLSDQHKKGKKNEENRIIQGVPVKPVVKSNLPVDGKLKKHDIAHITKSEENKNQTVGQLYISNSKSINVAVPVPFVSGQPRKMSQNEGSNMNISSKLVSIHDSKKLTAQDNKIIRNNPTDNMDEKSHELPIQSSTTEKVKQTEEEKQNKTDECCNTIQVSEVTPQDIKKFNRTLTKVEILPEGKNVTSQITHITEVNASKSAGFISPIQSNTFKVKILNILEDETYPEMLPKYNNLDETNNGIHREENIVSAHEENSVYPLQSSHLSNEIFNEKNAFNIDVAIRPIWHIMPPPPPDSRTSISLSHRKMEDILKSNNPDRNWTSSPDRNISKNKKNEGNIQMYFIEKITKDSDKNSKTKTYDTMSTTNQKVSSNQNCLFSPAEQMRLFKNMRAIEHDPSQYEKVKEKEQIAKRRKNEENNIKTKQNEDNPDRLKSLSADELMIACGMPVISINDALTKPPFMNSDFYEIKLRELGNLQEKLSQPIRRRGENSEKQLARIVNINLKHLNLDKSAIYKQVGKTLGLDDPSAIVKPQINKYLLDQEIPTDLKHGQHLSLENIKDTPQEYPVYPRGMIKKKKIVYVGGSPNENNQEVRNVKQRRDTGSWRQDMNVRLSPHILKEKTEEKLNPVKPPQNVDVLFPKG